MQTHQASCWRGPITPSRTDWPRAGDEPVPSLDDPEIRADLVRRIRGAIAAGTYDTPEKLEAALERFLEEIE